MVACRARSPGRGPHDRPGGAIIKARDKALNAAVAAQERKGQNLTIIDLEGRSDYADYIVIVSTYSERQGKAVADAVVRALKEQHGEAPVAREGQGVWVLVDYGDVVVHVFHEDARAYYDLDKIWADAPRVRVPALEYALHAV